MFSASSPLRLSSPQQEGVLRVSKWLKHQILIDVEEMENLFAALEPFFIFCVSDIVTADNYKIAREEFLESYAVYIASLKRGEIPDERASKRTFSSIFTVTPDILYCMQVKPERYLVKALKPVIQLQGHQFFVSDVDGKFHPMVLGPDSISWGIQFSYPQIYQDPKGHGFSKVADTAEFPNTALFTHLCKWIRTNTMPTPFLQDGKRVNIPIRLGKKCLSWINSHPQLKLKHLSVVQIGG